MFASGLQRMTSPEVSVNEKLDRAESEFALQPEPEFSDEVDAEKKPLLDEEEAEDVVEERYEPPAVVKPKLIIPAYITIPIWIGLSGGVILMNKHVFTDIDFPYPVFLTTYHMIFATIGTRLLRFIPGPLSETKIDIPWGVYCRTMVPLALLFSASLILSNTAYVYLSVSFVQMLKAWTPTLVLVIQLIVGFRQYNHLLLFIIAMLSVGCSIAASGQITFSVFGFACQIGGVIVESCRLVLIQYLLKDYDMNPIQSVTLYAPLCAISIGALIPLTEGLAPFQNIGNVGPLLLVANGLMAFSLNIACVFVIDSAGSLVLTLASIGKDILLILCAVFFRGASVSGKQVLGYGIAVLGLGLYRLTSGDPTTRYGKLVSTPARLLFTKAPPELPVSAPSSPR